MPKEVFELDKDERWQARLDEARARREVALREKADGKAQKPRLKPWEVDGVAIEDLPEIDPVIQERGDDKFDFADRLETIRSPRPEDVTPPRESPRPVGKPSRSAPEPAASVPPIPLEGEEAPPPPLPPLRRTSAQAKTPEARSRPKPSLVLPDAPDVSELAARYAATLDTAEVITSRRLSEPVSVPETPPHSAELVALPPMQGAPHDALELEPKLVAVRRGGIRPLGMAMVLLVFASLPLTTEAPPLEMGPPMPVVDTLRVQPALGVTWSLSTFPAQTSSAQWRPAAPARVLAPPPVLDTVSVAVAPRVDGFAAPLRLPSVELDWRTLLPIWPAPFVAPGLPALGPDSLPETIEEPPKLLAPDTSVAAPPRPEQPIEEITPDLPVDPAAAPPEPSRPSQTVVEADPLRVTVLAPTRVDRGLAEDIALGIQRDGHELLRVRSVDYSISARNVRYFHEEDRASAARLAERYNAELRDFTWFRPKPVAGTAELWLAGSAPDGNTNGRSQRGSGNTDRGEFLGNVFNRLGLGTELPENLPGSRVLRNVISGGAGN